MAQILKLSCASFRYVNISYVLAVWAERAVLGSAKTALKFKYEIQIAHLPISSPWFHRHWIIDAGI